MALLIAPWLVDLIRRDEFSRPSGVGVSMKLLLTSAGIKNPSINDAMLDLLGKPIAECDALCIPTASYGHPLPASAGRIDSSPGRPRLR